MTPEKKLRFDKACEALGVDEAQRERTWGIMMRLGMSPDDPQVMFLAVAGVLDKMMRAVHSASKGIPNAFASLPQMVKDAAEEAVGPVADAATKKVEAAHVKLAENAGTAIAASADSFFRQALREHRLNWSIAHAVVVGALLLAGLFTGYAFGRWNVAGLGAEVASYVQRADWPYWKALIAGNADLRNTVAGYCVAGSENVQIINGSRACTMRLWLDGTAGPAAGGPATAVYSSFLGFLNGYHPLALAGGGVLVGLLARKALKLLGKFPGVRWLTS